MQPTRLPRINSGNIVNAVAIGAITLPALARLFGVATDDPRLLARVHALTFDGRLTVSSGDLHTLTLTGGNH